MTELLRMELDGKEYSVRLLQRFGQVDPYLTPKKIQELWIEFGKHDTLFTDYTQGKVEPFLDVLFDVRSIIAVIYNVTNEAPYGSMLMNRVIPGFDGLAHFTIWDSKASGKEVLFVQMMKIWMDEFDLHRLSAEIPGHMSGVIRFAKRLGFLTEGVRREGNLNKGAWFDMEMLGILKSEVEQRLKEE
jgi:RimJ/RimL family protein N-acetyltransferase